MRTRTGNGTPAAIHRVRGACHVIVAPLVARVAVEHGLRDWRATRAPNRRPWIRADSHHADPRMSELFRDHPPRRGVDPPPRPGERSPRRAARRRHRAMHPCRAKCAHRRSPPPGPRRVQLRALCAARRPQSLPRLPPHRRRRGLRRPWCWPEGGREVGGPGRGRASSASARQPSRVRTRVRACAAARRRGRVRGLSNRIPVRRSDRRAPRERMA